ncbi:MAG: DUF2141 domain-containing protein [Spirochaetales bacterium]|nr:DUF2141 domain-containing protein [Spirochaetales bacterium]
MKRLLFLLFTLPFLFSLYGDTPGTLTIMVRGIFPEEGILLLALCDSPDNYKNKSDFFAVRKVAVTGPVMSIPIFPVPRGNYAVKVIHDENGNGALDVNIIGIPQESFGFSNNVMGKMGAPSFEQAMFSVRGDCSIAIDLITY